MKTAIDILLLVILVYGTWTGYKRGLIMGLAGVLVLVVSVYGANLLSNAFSYDVVPALRPFAGGYIEKMVDGEDGVLQSMDWDNDHNYSLNDLLSQYTDEHDEFAAECFRRLGITPAAADVMAESAVSYSREHNENLVDAIVHELCARISYMGCFVIAFLIIVIILTVVINLPNLSYKIPHLDLANDIAGTVIGFVTAAAYCAVFVWALKFMGIIIGGETLGDTVLGGWFLKHDFLAKILGV